MEQNTVGHIDLHCRSIHDHRSMLQINMEEGHRITFMIQRHQKLIVREELCLVRRKMWTASESGKNDAEYSCSGW